MSLTNLSDYGNVTGLASGFKVANELSGGLFGPLMLMAVGLVLMWVLFRFTDGGTAFGVPAVLCSILSVLGWAAGFVAGPVVIIFLVFGLAGLFLINKQ